MKAFMKHTLAIALLAGSTLSVMPAIAQAQQSQGGTGAAPILPRQGSGTQGSSGTTAPQGGTAGQSRSQSQDMGATTQRPSDSGTASGQNAQSQEANPQLKPKGESAGQEKPADAMNAESGDPKKPRSDDTAQQKPAGETGQTQDSNQAATSAPSNETTGSINVSTEQKTEIRSILVENKVEPVDIDINVSVGVAVPETVEFHPLPPRIVEIVPAYRGYEYFVLADGRIIIVEPKTHEVVYILAG